MGLRGLFLACGMALVGAVWGQYTDMECWLGAGVKQSVNKSWSWSLQWENRFTQDASWHEQGLVDAALEYRLNKHWDVNMQWRFSERQGLDGGYTARRRVALRAIGGWRLGPGKAAVRLMASEDWLARSVFLPNEATAVPANFTPVWRTRVGYGVRLNKRWKADASWEVFYRSGGRWNERWQLALGADLTKRWGAEVAYLWGNAWLDTDPWRSHVIRVQTNYALQKPKRPLRPVPATRVYESGKRMRMVPEPDCAVCDAAAIRITEVHTQGKPSDYIEIQNASNQPCSLKGWHITDAKDKDGWSLPEHCLASGAVVLGYEDGRNGFNFGLSSDGEVLFLVAPSGEIAVERPLLPALENRSQGLDSTGSWTHLVPTPGEVEADN